MEKEEGISYNHYTAEYWMYDSRLGRRWNVDPATFYFPSISPYVSFADNPIYFSDPLGLAPKKGKNSQGGKVLNKGEGKSKLGSIWSSVKNGVSSVFQSAKKAWENVTRKNAWEENDTEGSRGTITFELNMDFEWMEGSDNPTHQNKQKLPEKEEAWVFYRGADPAPMLQEEEKREKQYKKIVVDDSKFLTPIPIGYEGYLDLGKTISDIWEALVDLWNKPQVVLEAPKAPEIPKEIQEVEIRIPKDTFPGLEVEKGIIDTTIYDQNGGIFYQSIPHKK